ncbi:attachment glycoprotein [Wenzhou Apodemus agrarius jeilongvirus 1]|nr:attachment glycoprotein [Wenzhou Apodemus agrarius jeilongvirus 1]WPV62460.1 MAG: attachment glycoprotein [Jingmen rodent jeilongvirus 1]
MSQLAAHNLAMSNFYGTQRGDILESKKSDLPDPQPIFRYASMIVGLLSLFTIIALNVTNIIYLTESGGTMQSIKNNQDSLSGSVREASGLLIEDIKPKTDLINSMVSYNIPTQLSMIHSMIKNEVLKQCTPSFMFNNTVCPIVENPAHSHYFEEVNLEGFSGCKTSTSKVIINSNASFVEYPSFIPGSTKPGSCIRFPSFSLSTSIFAYAHTIMGHGCSELDIGDHYFSIGRIADHGHDQPVFETLTEWFVNDKINRRTCTVAAGKVGAWMACIIMTETFYEDMMSPEHGKVTISYLDIYGRKREWMYSKSEIRVDYPMTSMYFSIGSGAVVGDTVYFLVWGAMTFPIEQNAYCNAPGCSSWTQQMCNTAQRPPFLGNRQILNALLYFKTNTDGKPILSLRAFTPGNVPLGSEGRLIYFETTQKLYIYLRSTSWHALPLTGLINMGPPISITWFEQRAVSRPGNAPCGASNRCPRTCMTGVYTDLFPLGTSYEYSVTAYLDSETRRINPVLAFIDQNSIIYRRTVTNTTQKAEYTTTTCFTFKLRIWCLSIIEMAPSTITSYEPVPFLYQLDVTCLNFVTNITAPLMNGAQPYSVGPYEDPRNECYFERLGDDTYFIVSIPSAIQAYAIRQNPDTHGPSEGIFVDDLCPLALSAFKSMRPSMRGLSALVIGNWQLRPVKITGGLRMPLLSDNKDQVPARFISPEDPGHNPFPGDLYTGDPCNKKGRHCICYDSDWNEIYTPGPDDYLFPPTTPRSTTVFRPVSMENHIINETQQGVTPSYNTRGETVTKSPDLNGGNSVGEPGLNLTENSIIPPSKRPGVNPENMGTKKGPELEHQATTPMQTTRLQNAQGTTKETLEFQVTTPNVTDQGTTRHYPTNSNDTMQTAIAPDLNHPEATMPPIKNPNNFNTSTPQHTTPSKNTTVENKFNTPTITPLDPPSGNTEGEMTEAFHRTITPKADQSNTTITIKFPEETNNSTESGTATRKPVNSTDTDHKTYTTTLTHTPTVQPQSSTTSHTQKEIQPKPEQESSSNLTTKEPSTTSKQSKTSTSLITVENPTKEDQTSIVIQRNITKFQDDHSIIQESNKVEESHSTTPRSRTEQESGILEPKQDTLPNPVENEEPRMFTTPGPKRDNDTKPSQDKDETDKDKDNQTKVNIPENNTSMAGVGGTPAPGAINPKIEATTKRKCDKESTTTQQSTTTTPKTTTATSILKEDKQQAYREGDSTGGDKVVATDQREQNPEEEVPIVRSAPLQPPEITYQGAGSIIKMLGSFMKVSESATQKPEVKPPEKLELIDYINGDNFTYNYHCPKTVSQFFCRIIWHHKFKLADYCNGTISMLAVLLQIDFIDSNVFLADKKKPIVPPNYYLCFNNHALIIHQAPFETYKFPEVNRIIQMGPWHGTYFVKIAPKDDVSVGRLPFGKKDFLDWSWSHLANKSELTCVLSELCGYPLVVYRNGDIILGFYISYKNSVDMTTMPRSLTESEVCGAVMDKMITTTDTRGIEISIEKEGKNLLLQSTDDEVFFSLTMSGGKCVQYSMQRVVYPGYVERLRPGKEPSKSETHEEVVIAAHTLLETNTTSDSVLHNAKEKYHSLMNALRRFWG